MKKLLVFVLVLVMVFTLAACGSQEEPKSLYDHGLDVVALLSEMTKLEDYSAIFTGNKEIQNLIHQSGSYADEDIPAVYSVSIPEEALANMLQLDAIGNVSDGLKNHLMHRALSSFASQINAMGGAEALAASSICTAEKTFVYQDMAENVIYLYFYKNAAPVAVTFIMGEDNTVTATGSLILYDGFTDDLPDTIQSVFDGVPVAVTNITPQK